MEIRKTFKFEMAHIVRNAWSKRCSLNVHGHSYTVEVFFEQSTPLGFGNGGMIIDFGIIKKYGNDFIDSFDHSLSLWDVPADKDFIAFAKEHFERVIVTKFPTSAEVQAAMFFHFFDSLLEVLREEDVIDWKPSVSRVIVHETATGKAQFTKQDYHSNLVNIQFKDMWISEGIRNAWKEKAITELIIGKGDTK